MYSDEIADLIMAGGVFIICCCTGVAVLKMAGVF